MLRLLNALTSFARQIHDSPRNQASMASTHEVIAFVIHTRLRQIVEQILAVARREGILH
jgi:hypothetical protein